MADETNGSDAAKAMGAKGGKARAARMTPEERSASAKKAADAKWAASLPKATHGDPDHPIRVGDSEIGCYVLEDGRRVISQRGLQNGIGLNPSGGARRLLSLVGTFSEKGLNCRGLLSRISEPIKFVNSSGVVVHGYEATTLADLCDLFLDARKDGVLKHQQVHVAAQCEILMRSFAKVGIIALVDEATGYQDARERDALAKIYEAFVAKELRPYLPTFDAEYYKELCRLKGWPYVVSSRRPRIIGNITNDIVYSRLAPGILTELKRINPVVKDGRRKSKHFQWLTVAKGNPELQKHLSRIIGWMEMSDTWEGFYRMLNTRKPVFRGLTLFGGSEESGDGS